MNLFNQNYHIEIHMHKLQLHKKKKKKVGCNKDSMERPLVNIYKFWKFDNRFLIGIGFKILTLRYMLYVLLKRFFFFFFWGSFIKHLLLICLKKLIRTNKLLSLLTKI